MELSRWAPLALLVLAVAGCGGASNTRSANEGPAASELRKQLGAATDPASAEFPAVGGRTLQQVGDDIGQQGPEAVAATSILHPGRNRFAFGVLQDNEFVYGPSAVYVAARPDAVARGPYPAPADLLVTEKRYRSRQAATEKDPFSAVYSADVKLPNAKQAFVLVVTSTRQGLIVAPLALKLTQPDEDNIPDVGDPAPARAFTETIDDTAGNEDALDTREPHDPMHDTDLAGVLGRKPAAVLFATPQLCQSRVCGPVTDIELQMRARYGDRMTFIHQEVYVNNNLQQGIREPLKRFGLPTEPWLFVFDRDARLTARLEGSFGLSAFESAVRSGLD